MRFDRRIDRTGPARQILVRPDFAVAILPYAMPAPDGLIVLTNRMDGRNVSNQLVADWAEWKTGTPSNRQIDRRVDASPPKKGVPTSPFCCKTHLTRKHWERPA